MNISIWNADTTRSLQLLRTLLAGGRPTVVAGCVTDGSEQQPVIEALTVLPLDFGKPMTVSPGWDRTYPSFPVFEMLPQPDELMEADDAAALEAAWTHCLEQGPSRTALDARARQALAKARGAAELHLQALAPLLAALLGQRPGRS